MNYLRPRYDWLCGGTPRALGDRTAVMAVLNLTPDSFYSGSRVPAGYPAAVVEHAHAALAEGADILDLGAESTRPGSTPLSAGEEQRRLLPSLTALRAALPHALLSADTRHASTARAALDAGADVINDVSGGADPAMFPLLAASSCGVVLMHTRGEFATMQKLPPLPDPLHMVQSALAVIAYRATEAGIARERIVLDPGFGFGKNLDENFPLLRDLDQLHAFGYPLLAGLSRKSFLRRDAEQGPEHRLPASLAAAAAAALAGAHIIRAHDVAPTADAVRIADHLLRPAKPIRIRRAAAQDRDAIAALLEANIRDHGGELQGPFSSDRIAAWLSSPLPVLVAESGPELLGVLVSGERSNGLSVPILAAMLAAYPGSANSYLYGPVCVARAARGRGIAAALWAELQARLPDREAILFIRETNPRSLRAHEKMGLERAAAFDFSGDRFAVFRSVSPRSGPLL